MTETVKWRDRTPEERRRIRAEAVETMGARDTRTPHMKIADRTGGNRSSAVGKGGVVAKKAGTGDSPLHRIGRTWRRAADREQRLRAERDAEIRRARDAGLGVREIARAAEVDPTQVLRVLRRGGD